MAKHGRHKARGKAKVGVVLGEFKRGTLRSGSGKKVKSRKQAVAIALSEARKAGARIPKAKGSTYYGPIPQDRAPSVHGSVPADPARPGDTSSYTRVRTPVWRY